MKSSTPKTRQNLRRLRADFPFFARHCLKIRTKSGKIVPLELNRAQLYIHGRLEEQRARTGMVRALILKGRQQGASTYIGARFYWRSSLQRGVKVFILTHLKDATNNIFKMVERFHKHSPLRPSTSKSNAKELFFDRLDSGYAVGTAGSQAVGRSDTVQLFHGSEAAFWKNAPAHFAGVVQAIPELPGTESILESTANGVGGEFHGRCKQAMAGIGDYQLIFVPWFWQAEYRRPVPDDFEFSEEEGEYYRLHRKSGCSREHMVWRRARIIELKDPLLFKQEYPATPDEAFQTTGHDSFIKPESVLRARKANLRGVGPLIIGVDPKRHGTDRFGIAWRRGRKIERLEGDNAPIDTMRAAAKLKDIIDADKPAAVFIDAGGGAGIYDTLVAWEGPYKRICKLVSFGGKPVHPPKVDKDGRPMAGPLNRRAEMWSLSRDWLEQEGGADVPDEDGVQADACAPGYYYQPVTSQLTLEAKEDIEDRGLPSPDLWDAIALTFAEPVKETSSAKLAQPNLGIA